MISFKLLEQYLNNANINLIMSKSGDEITVSLLPLPKIKDDAKSNLKPIIIRGTAAELDEQFHVIIQKPLEKVSGIVSNIIEFEASAEKVAAESKINDKAKEDNSKATKIADKFISKAKALMVTREYKKAMLKVDGALKAVPSYSKALELKEEIKKLDTPDLFKEKIVDSTLKVADIVVLESKEYLQENPKTVKEAIESTLKNPVILGAESKEEEEQVREALKELEQPISIKEIVEASPNVITASIPTEHEEAGVITKEHADEFYAEPDNSAESPRWNEDEFEKERGIYVEPQQENIDPDLETLF